MYTVASNVDQRQMERLMRATHDIYNLSTFKRETAKIVRQLKRTRRPIVITIKGKPELVIQDAESYWKLVQTVDRIETVAGIKHGLESMKRNTGKPAETFFEEFFMEKGLSERE